MENNEGKQKTPQTNKLGASNDSLRLYNHSILEPFEETPINNKNAGIGSGNESIKVGNN